MRNSSRKRSLTMVLLGLTLTAGCERSAEPQPSVHHKNTKYVGNPAATAEDDIFRKPRVLRIDIEIPRSGMNQLRRTQWGGGGGEERPVAKATVREGNVVYEDVAVHLKGAAGSFRPVDDHPALTLNFDKFVPGQSFHGLHKISLNNSVQDPSYLSEKICREIFDAAGVPVPRAGHAIVKFNGQDMGLYVLVEGANKQFLKRYFNNTKGNLFDGGFVRDIDEGLSVNSGDDPEDRSGLQTLVKVARDRSAKLADLEKVLDVDRFLSMMAVEALICHWDGYVMNKNNWRVFHDLDSGRMIFIPHGMDQTFGIGQRGRREGQILPPTSGVVAAAVMRNPEGKRRYRERFVQVYTNVFKVESILARIDEVESVVREAMVLEDPQTARYLEEQATEFKRRIVQRQSDVKRQLAAVSTPPHANGQIPPRLTGWRSFTGTGTPRLVQEKDDSGKQILAVRAGAGLCSGSWRTQVVLPAGHYQFNGNMRVNNVKVSDGDSRAGAGLRISRGTMPEKWVGTTEWKEFHYPFEIDEDSSEVEVVCELRSLTGEALFDLDSLRIVRIP